LAATSFPTFFDSKKSSKPACRQAGKLPPGLACQQILAIPLSFCEKRKWRKKITAPARAVANSCRGLAKITKDDVAP